MLRNLLGEIRELEQRGSPCQQVQVDGKERTAASISQSGTKELQALGLILPMRMRDRMYYIELADGASPIRARNKVSQCF